MMPNQIGVGPRVGWIVRALWCAGLLCVGLWAQAPPAPSALHTVRSIYIVKPDFREPSQADVMQTVLAKEVRAIGLGIVESEGSADATLAAGFCPDSAITLDWDEWDPTYPRPSYCFRLTSTAGEQLWRAKIYVGKGQTFEGEFKEAAVICARKLSAARKKSARNAGR